MESALIRKTPHPRLSSCQQEVLGVFKPNRSYRMADIQAALLKTPAGPLADQTVYQCLSKLRQRGLIERLRPGVYRLPGDHTVVGYLEPWILQHVPKFNAVSAREAMFAYREERGPTLPEELFEQHMDALVERGYLMKIKGYWYVATSKKPVIDIFEE